MIDKVEASRLRSEGHMYSSIAAQMGCSVAWCKSQLRDIPKGNKVVSDGTETKLAAIKILEDALVKLRGI